MCSMLGLDNLHCKLPSNWCKADRAAVRVTQTSRSAGITELSTSTALVPFMMPSQTIVVLINDSDGMALAFIGTWL